MQLLIALFFTLLTLASAAASPPGAWKRIQIKRDPKVSYVVDEYVARADGLKYYGLQFDDDASNYGGRPTASKTD